MKKYINLEGLSRFLENISGIFVGKEDVITETEVDEICGMTDYDIQTQSKNEILLTDKATGENYRLYIEDGKLSMESDDSASNAAD